MPTSQTSGQVETAQVEADRLRLLFVRNLFFPEDLGGNRYPYEVATRLASRGHALALVASRSPVAPRYAVEPAGLDLHAYPTLRWHPLLTHCSHVAGSAAALWRLRHWQPAVALASSYDVALAVLHQPALRRVPLVFIYHSEFYSVWAKGLERAGAALSPGRALGALTATYMRWVERRVFAGAARIIAVSQFSARQIAARLPDAATRTVVIPTGVDTRFFAPVADRSTLKLALGLDPAVPLVLGVGRLTPVKRFDRLVKAIGQLRAGGAAVALALAGDGPEAGSLRALAERLGLGAAIRFTGYLPAEQLRRWMQAADVQVCSSEFENHSLAILEALACGTPVLGTPAGGTPEILRAVDDRLLLAGPEPAQLAQALAALLAEPASLETLRGRCRRVAEQQYDWEVVVSALERLLFETVRGWKAGGLAGRRNERFSVQPSTLGERL